MITGIICLSETGIWKSFSSNEQFKRSKLRETHLPEVDSPPLRQKECLKSFWACYFYIASSLWSSAYPHYRKVSFKLHFNYIRIRNQDKQLYYTTHRWIFPPYNGIKAIFHLALSGKNPPKSSRRSSMQKSDAKPMACCSKQRNTTKLQSIYLGCRLKLSKYPPTRLNPFFVSKQDCLKYSDCRILYTKERTQGSGNIKFYRISHSLNSITVSKTELGLCPSSVPRY